MVDKNNTNSEDKMNQMNLDLNPDFLCEGSFCQIINIGSNKNKSPVISTGKKESKNEAQKNNNINYIDASNLKNKKENELKNLSYENKPKPNSIKKCSTIDKENISTTYKNTSKIVKISSDSDPNDYNIDKYVSKALFYSIFYFINYFRYIINIQYNLYISSDFIESFKNKNINDYEKILDIKIKEFYLGKFLEKNSKESLIKNEIEYLFKNEKQKENNIPNLDIYFSTTIKDIINIYINNYPEIEYSNYKVLLKNYKIFENDLNEYGEQLKNKIKQRIDLLLNKKKINEISSNNLFLPKVTYIINGKQKENNDNTKNIFQTKIINNLGLRLSNLTNKKLYDIRRQILRICLENYVKVIKFYYEKYKNKKFKKLHIPYIKKQIRYSFEDYRKFFEKKTFNIFCDSLPKSINIDKRKEMKDKDEYNRDLINEIIEKEEQTESEENRILYFLFMETKFKIILCSFLDEKTEITVYINNKVIIIPLVGFKTFNTCFDNYENDLKIYLKEDMKGIILGKETKYKGRKKKILKNNFKIKKK